MSETKKKSQSPVELQALIKSGNLSSVVEAIQGLNRKKILRSDLVHYANIANRVDQWRLAYRFLNPLIRSSGDSSPPSEEETIEYAEALRGLGLIQEAIKLLQEIDANRFPVADLRISFCLVSQWRYAEAIPYLRRYISSENSKDEAKRYTLAIAKVNLAAALIGSNNSVEALTLLKSLTAETNRAGHQLLYGNCLELLAQLYVGEGQCDLADQTLEEAQAFFSKSNTNSRFALYWRKWRAISKSIQQGTVHPELFQCRDSAIQNRDWETHRDCDLYIGFLNKDQDLLSKVYFGTPFEAYRNRILSLAGDAFKPREAYVWNQWKEQPVTVTLDLIEGQFESGGVSLEAGQLMHRMLILLVSDFYRPLTAGRAFSELFPGEDYSQTGSLSRVHQAVNRLREWSQKNGGLISIEEDEGTYRLRTQPGVGIRIPMEIPRLSLEGLIWLQFRNRLQEEIFTRNEVMSLLKCSQASANRLLRWSLKEGQCETISAGSHRKYRLKKLHGSVKSVSS